MLISLREQCLFYFCAFKNSTEILREEIIDLQGEDKWEDALRREKHLEAEKQILPFSPQERAEA